LSCRAAWFRLPVELRAAIQDNYRRYPCAHMAAVVDAIDWLKANPAPAPSPAADVAAAVADLADVLAGTGRHAGHERRQVGRCVHCSCGARAQGRMVTR
jgi:hypothetical protein